jgi:hypothetical protein
VRLGTYRRSTKLIIRPFCQDNSTNEIGMCRFYRHTQNGSPNTYCMGITLSSERAPTSFYVLRPAGVEAWANRSHLSCVKVLAWYMLRP